MSLFNALCIWVIGLCIAWVGDAGHVASGTTTYSPSAWPVVWKSPLWFPLAVGGYPVHGPRRDVSSVSRQVGRHGK
jgi:hypothetical protein